MTNWNGPTLKQACTCIKYNPIKMNPSITRTQSQKVIALSSELQYEIVTFLPLRDLETFF